MRGLSPLSLNEAVMLIETARARMNRARKERRSSRGVEAGGLPATSDPWPSRARLLLPASHRLGLRQHVPGAGMRRIALQDIPEHRSSVVQAIRGAVEHAQHES